MKSNYGKTLKNIRENLCLTQQEMAYPIMSQANYSKIENGTSSSNFEDMLN